MKTSRCDPRRVREFDYSALSPAFGKLAKPAQRALIGAGILTPRDLARRTLAEVRGLHGLGPGSLPTLRAALRKSGLAFRKDADAAPRRSPKSRLR